MFRFVFDVFFLAEDKRDIAHDARARRRGSIRRNETLTFGRDGISDAVEVDVIEIGVVDVGFVVDITGALVLGIVARAFVFILVAFDVRRLEVPRDVRRDARDGACDFSGGADDEAPRIVDPKEDAGAIVDDDEGERAETESSAAAR